MKSKKLFILLSALALSLAACGQSGNKSSSNQASQDSTPSQQSGGEASSSDQGGEVAVTSITLDKQTLALEEGKSETLKATVLPENASNTKVNWASSDATIATVSSLGKVTAVKAGTAKITASSVSNPEVKAECTVTVTEEGGKYGSANKPKTVAEILAIAAEECKNSNDKTSDVVYVKGLVSRAPNNKGTYSQNIYLKDKLTDGEDKELLVYSANHDALKEPYQNDEVVLHGYLMNYNGTIEVSNVTINNEKIYPEVDAVTRGTSTITYTIDHGTLAAGAPTSGKNLSEFTFSVNPNEGFKVDSVTVNGDEVAAQADGSYKGLVKGNTAVVINISEVGVEVLRAVMKYVPAEGSASGNMTGGNDAALVNLDPTIFSAVSGNETGIYAGLNVAGNIRLYNNRNSTTDKTDGTHLTVSSVRATIKKIEITRASSDTGGVLQVKAGNTVVTEADGAYEINAGSFTLKNVTDGEESKQVHITQVAITYVMNQEVAATAIAVSPKTAEVRVGQDVQLAAALTPVNATDVVTWSSSDDTKATVDQTGKVVAVAEGTVTITAKVSETIKDTATITVIAAEVINYGTAANPLTVAEAKAVLDKTGSNNSAQPLYVKGIVSTNKAYNSSYGNYDEVWLQNEDGSVDKAFELYRVKLDASITENPYTAADSLRGCEVVGYGFGKIYSSTYELTTASSDPKNPLILSIVPPAATDPTGVTLNKESLELEVGATSQLSASLQPAGATGTVTWSSNAEAVATVDNTGKVTAVGAGSAVITAKVSDTIKAECAVTVTAPAVETKALPADGLAINFGTIGLGSNTSYASNNNRTVKIGDFNVTLDPDSVGTVMKASAPYVSANCGTDCMQFKKGELSGFVVKTHIEAAKKATVKMIVLGYATEGKDYLPTFKIGNSSTAILCNESNNGTQNVAGTDTGLKYTQSGTEKVIYEYTLTYDLSALSDQTLTFVTAKSGAAYIASIVIDNNAATPSPTVVPLPIIAKGNQDTKVEGAGAWIYLDVTGLTLTAEMAAAMAAAAQIQLTVAMTEDTPESAQSAAQNYVTGQAAAPVVVAEQVRFDDFGTNTVRLYIGMDKGLDNSWMMKHSFEIRIPLNETTVYEGSVEFVGGALKKINGEAYVAPVVIAQPTGTFFASAELTDDGKTALGAAGNIVPVFIKLGADSASVNVDGASAGACSIKSYDQSNGWLVITTAAFGDLSMQYNPETKDLEKLSVVANTGILKYDGGQSLKGNEKLKYWNCDGTTEELQAQWNRRYGDPWTLDTNNADRVTQNTEFYKSGSAMRLRPYADNRFALATKDFSEPFNARNISFWVYNSGTADATIQCFAYKSTGYSNFIQPFSNKTIPAGQWTYVSAGFTATDLYGFQIFVAKTASALIFDDICLF